MHRPVERFVNQPAQVAFLAANVRVILLWIGKQLGILFDVDRIVCRDVLIALPAIILAVVPSRSGKNCNLLIFPASVKRLHGEHIVEVRCPIERGHGEPGGSVGRDLAALGSNQQIVRWRFIPTVVVVVDSRNVSANWLYDRTWRVEPQARPT